MKRRYQRTRGKSKGKFEVIGGRELSVRLALPVVEVWQELQPQVERLAGEAGLRIMQEILDEEVRQRVGSPCQSDPATGNQRWGRQPGYVLFGGQKIDIERPRVRTRTGKELERDSYRRLQQDGGRRLRNAYAMTDYATARVGLEKLWRELCDVNPSAARSLEGSMEETLTPHRRGVGPLRRRTLSTTNAMEPCLSTVRHVTRKGKRW